MILEKITQMFKPYKAYTTVSRVELDKKLAELTIRLKSTIGEYREKYTAEINYLKN